MLPEAPKRVVAQTTPAAALWDLGIQVVGVIGPNLLPDGTNDFQAGTIDFASTVSLGDYGTDSLEIDMEKLVELQPDLILDMSYGCAFWYIESDRETLEQIAPLAGISMDKVSILTSIEQIEELAVALGADLDAPTVTADRAAFAATPKQHSSPRLPRNQDSPSFQSLHPSKTFTSVRRGG